ncbi:MAG TPA: RNA polymerase sigma factor [Pyrinomonadaceae bacterium]|jgi:RNA polymerase sigma-70 factor (ECF subfamily)|nr:RNA polymerase sigma factor [Pyrinomonadaceae bacterium]
MAGSHVQTDAELLRLMLGGDEEAFTALYRRRQGGVYRFALQMSGSEALAEDVAQEVFMVLMRDGGNFDPSRGSLAAYLYGIARNHVLRAFERERSFVPLETDADDSNDAPHANLVAHFDPLGDLTRGEMVEKLRQAVLALPAHYREALVLCELHELSYADAAGALGCAVGTVRSRLHRARAMLAEKMRGREREGARVAGGESELGAEGGDAQAGVLKAARCFA